MDALIQEWGGVERAFALDFGLVCDLEEACGEKGVGGIYVRLATHQYHAREVYQTIRHGLIGGGMSRPDVERLMKTRFNEIPLADSVALAVDLLTALNTGVKDDRTRPASGDVDEPYDLGKIFASFAQVGVTPQQVRAMGYSDFCNLMRAVGGDKAQPPTEDEFADMIRRHGEVHDG
ncbi:gene transfer agent family protein [Pararhodobacter sp.]|uniref:gene transfer agent family protein n=1 Tax=Pararhodobacter sp. TaxID=2127056 RepID=UPI002AFEC313|nr:gene transfer agent family protein [Pararhodobacter sp.]